MPGCIRHVVAVVGVENALTVDEVIAGVNGGRGVVVALERGVVVTEDRVGELAGTGETGRGSGVEVVTRTAGRAEDTGC